MIEILFAESEAASMKRAKKSLSGWIEGTPKEVVCLGFMLDVGDIKKPVNGTYRKELLCSMYAQNQWEQDEKMEAELRKSAGICKGQIAWCAGGFL